jgi:hypothetical protein
MNEVPKIFADVQKHVRTLSDAVNLLIRGHGNYYGTLTIPMGNTLTTISDPRALRSAMPILIPLNASASGLAYYISDRRDGEFDITSAAPAADASFGYVLHAG